MVLDFQVSSWTCTELELKIFMYQVFGFMELANPRLPYEYKLFVILIFIPQTDIRNEPIPILV